MDSECAKVLKILCENPEYTRDHYYLPIDVGVIRGELIRIGKCLEDAGYILNVSYPGNKKIQCQVTDAGMEKYKELFGGESK